MAQMSATNQPRTDHPKKKLMMNMTHALEAFLLNAINVGMK